MTLASPRLVSMRPDAVSRDRLVGFTVQHRNLGTATGTTDPALAVNDDITRLDQPRLGQRGQWQQRRGRIASRVGNDVCLANLVGKEFRHPIDRPSDTLGPRMLDPIPLLIDLNAGQSKVGTEIDHPQSLLLRGWLPRWQG